jgi:hypothetical protein
MPLVRWGPRRRCHAYRRKDPWILPLGNRNEDLLENRIGLRSGDVILIESMSQFERLRIVRSVSSCERRGESKWKQYMKT